MNSTHVHRFTRVTTFVVVTTVLGAFCADTVRAQATAKIAVASPQKIFDAIQERADFVKSVEAVKQLVKQMGTLA